MKFFKRKKVVKALAATAPPGGNVVEFGDAYAIWLPEDWTLGGEEDPDSGKPNPVWHRKNNPQGALRISTLEVRRELDLLEFAREMYEDMRKDCEISEFKVEEKPDRVMASWRTVSQEPGIEGMTVTWVWEVIMGLKSLLMTFSYDQAKEGSNELQDEVSAAEKIAHNSVPL